MTDKAFRTETVETAAGTYTVGLHYDADPQNPLDNMSTFSTAYLAGGRDFCQMAINGEATGGTPVNRAGGTVVDLLANAIERGHSLAAVVRYFRMFHGARGFVELNRIGGNGGSYIEANQVRLPEDQTDYCTETDTRAAQRRFDGLAFVLPRDLGPEGAGFTPVADAEEDALALVKGEMETYAAYANGEVYGYTVTRDEDEDEVDSCWGYYGDDEFDYMLECGREAAQYDAEERAKEAAILAWLDAERRWETASDMVTVTTYRSEIDGAAVVEIDTTVDGGRLRVNVNDGTVFDADPEQGTAIERLKAAHGGTWGQHPAYPQSDWRGEVVNADTVLGYWEWVQARLENA